MNIYVGNLPGDITEEDLRKEFEAFGQVASTTVMKDKESGVSRGFGFVEMLDNAEAQSAITGLNGKELNEQKLVVREAQGPSLSLSKGRMRVLVAYNVLFALLSSPALILLVAWSPYLPAQTELSDVESKVFQAVLLFTLITIIVAGTTGGTLCNLRGLFKHIYAGGGCFPTGLEMPFYIRPFIGALTGLLSFFLSSLLFTSLSIDASNPDWVSLPGRVPYIGVALLAGFAAQEFMQKLKEVAKNLFSHST